MSRSLAAAIFACAALLAAPALAQPSQPQGHASGAAASNMPTHEMCKSVMGRKMDGKPAHDHVRDKTGQMTWPNGKPLTAAEMKKMHEQCATRMSGAKK